MGVGTGSGEVGVITSREPKYQKVTKEQVALWIKEEEGRNISVKDIKELNSSSPSLQVFSAKLKKKRKKLICWVYLGMGIHNFSYVKK